MSSESSGAEMIRFDFVPSLLDQFTSKDVTSIAALGPETRDRWTGGRSLRKFVPLAIVHSRAIIAAKLLLRSNLLVAGELSDSVRLPNLSR